MDNPIAILFLLVIMVSSCNTNAHMKTLIEQNKTIISQGKK